MSLLIVSCSSDKSDDDAMDESAIIGEWRATALTIDNETASDDAKFGKQILDFLTAQDCYVITFKFNQDQTAVVENSVNYLEVNVGGNGLVIPCPTAFDTNTSTYSYNGQVLSYEDEDGETVTVNVTINADVMMVDAAGLNIPNFNDSGELVFIRTP